MARKQGPYRPEVVCGEGDGDHDPGDPEAGCYHGKLLGVEGGSYVEMEQGAG
jgi:hypothetical protein